MPTSTWDTLADTLLMHQCETFYGQQVTYTPALTGVPVNVLGIFEAAATIVEADGEVQVESRAPVLRIRKKNLDDAEIDPEHDDFVTADGVNYRVVDTQPDGHAEITIILMRAP